MTQARVFIVAPTPTLRAGLRSMLAAVESTDLVVVGEGAASEPERRLSEADVVLVADEGWLEEVPLSVSEEGTQSLLLLSDDEDATSRLRSLSVRGWGVVPPDAPSEVARGPPSPQKPRPNRPPADPAAPIGELPEPLTARESQVLGLLGGGL